MARSTGPKLVQCYLCGHRFEVGAMAQSTSCPGCNKPVIVADEEIKTGKRRGPIRELRTCGRIKVGKRARLMAEQIVAHGGIENLGIIEAKSVIAGPGLYLGPKSEFKGELHSQVVVMDSGAKVKPSMFHVPSDPSGLLEKREAPPKEPPSEPKPKASPAIPTSSTRRSPAAKKSATKKPVTKKVVKKAAKKASKKKAKKPPRSGDSDAD